MRGQGICVWKCILLLSPISCLCSQMGAQPYLHKASLCALCWPSQGLHGKANLVLLMMTKLVLPAPTHYRPYLRRFAALNGLKGTTELALTAQQLLVSPGSGHSTVWKAVYYTLDQQPIVCSPPVPCRLLHSSCW